MITVPIPTEAAAAAEPTERATNQALKEAEQKRIGGRDITPFLLGRIAELTKAAWRATSDPFGEWRQRRRRRREILKHLAIAVDGALHQLAQRVHFVGGSSHTLRRSRIVCSLYRSSVMSRPAPPQAKATDLAPAQPEVADARVGTYSPMRNIGAESNR